MVGEPLSLRAARVSVVTANLTAGESPPLWRIALNFVVFQAGWFAAVVTAAKHEPWIGIGVVALIVAVHIASATRPSREAALVAITAVIGATWDTLMVQTHWMTYAPGTVIANTAPLWIVALWALFATALNVSLNWLKNRDLLGFAVGAVAGPMSYYGGVKLGALAFDQPAKAVIALAIGWGIFVPVLMRLAKRFDGITK
jgi:hypothetical protein